MTTLSRHPLARRIFPFFAGALFALLLMLVALYGCYLSTSPSVPGTPNEKAEGPPWFEDVTDELGIDFVHDPGPTDSYFMPQSFGSGCAFIQEADGTLYVYLLNAAGPTSKSVNRLYCRQPDGKFQDVTAGSGLDIAGYNLGVAVADVNNDGLPDVLVTQYGGIKLFLNLGGGRFEDVTAESGLSNPLWGASAAFFDYDRDGWLDLFVANYLDYDPQHECFAPNGGRDYCGPGVFKGTCSKLFHNLGPGPTAEGKTARVRFEDVSFKSGIGRLPGPGLGVVCADFNGDGWPDIFVANDGVQNRLWINKHDGTFVDEAPSRGVAFNNMGIAFAGMGVAAGDTANRGSLDLFVTHLTIETNTLWRQGKRGHFHDETVQAGLSTCQWRGTGFGTILADFNLDGWLDAAIANGGVARGGTARNTGLGFFEPYAERNQLFANDGTGKFRDISASNKALCGNWNVARGLACADINDDGAPDLLVTTIGNRARLLRNIAPDRGHWLKVRAVDPQLKRDVYGAEVRVRCGQQEYLRLVSPAGSFCCSNSPIAFFGLGKATQVDSIRVTWPDGKPPEEFDGGPVDRLRELRRGEGRKQ